MAGDDETAPRPAQPQIDVSHKARARIQRRGGKIYVWARGVGGGLATQEVTFQPPRSAMSFVRFPAPSVRGPIDVFVETGIPIPPEIRVDLSPWPFRRILVQGFGADWPEADGLDFPPAPPDPKEYD